MWDPSIWSSVTFEWDAPVSGVIENNISGYDFIAGHIYQ